MLRVPKRGWMPPSLKFRPSNPPMRWAVPASPSGPAAYDRWSRRMSSILRHEVGGPGHRVRFSRRRESVEPACAQGAAPLGAGRPLRLAPDRTVLARVGRMDREPLAGGEVLFAVHDQ